MNIVPCREEDISALLALTEAFLKEQIQFEPAFTPRKGWREGCVEFTQKIINSDNYFLDLARNGDDRIVGFHMYGINNEPLMAAFQQGYIADLFVTPEHRRKGYALRLVRHGIKQMKNLGVHFIQLNVLLNNPDGIAFWKAVGFNDFIARMKMDTVDLERVIAEEGDFGD
ncbi:GNAT family N-acetyltransferase [Planctomycetota bacterium]